MKSCEQVLLYAQGELNASEKVAFEAHLKTCAVCQNTFKFLTKLDQNLICPAVPEQVVEKLWARTTRKKSFWARFKWGWTVATVLACTGVFLLMFSPTRQTFNAQELVAYMSATVEDEYSSFTHELTDMEGYF